MGRLLLFFVFKERKSRVKFVFSFLLFGIIGYQYYKPMINSNESFYFVNVGQGDCSVFLLPNSKKAVLVDVGGSKYKDVAVKEIIPFLESRGVNEIETIILTHDDFDHIGGLNSLKNNFKVNKVIDSSLTENVQIGKKMFRNLNVSRERDNDGSIVLYGEYGGYYLLLMGDASIDVEKEISKEVDVVDIIKIGHHGSDTSSGYEFLDMIDGKIAIISVGNNNMYGHPHESVIDNLEALGYVIFRTDYNDDIGFW